MNKIKHWGFSGLLILVFFLFSVLVFFNSDYQKSLRELFAPPERKILSVATGRIFPDRGMGKVLKIMTADEGMILEIYAEPVSGAPPLVDRITIGKHRDAFFQFQARATNLALKDMDGDNVFEIIAPSFDSSLVSRLNIFRFNSDSKHFEPYLE
jgi:hypothetical protein